MRDSSRTVEADPTLRLAVDIREIAKQAEPDDASELLRVLARLLEGRDVYSAFGAPGDWGYGTRVGDALSVLYRAELPLARLIAVAQ